MADSHAAQKLMRRLIDCYPAHTLDAPRRSAPLPRESLGTDRDFAELAEVIKNQELTPFLLAEVRPFADLVDLSEVAPEVVAAILQYEQKPGHTLLVAPYCNMYGPRKNISPYKEDALYNTLLPLLVSLKEPLVLKSALGFDALFRAPFPADEYSESNEVTVRKASEAIRPVLLKSLKATPAQTVGWFASTLNAEPGVNALGDAIAQCCPEGVLPEIVISALQALSTTDNDQKDREFLFTHVIDTFM